MLAGRSTGGGRPPRAPPVRGELLALFTPLALLGSELDGVGCSRRADRLALLGRGAALLLSECELLGGETDNVLLGGVCVIGWLVEGALETALIPGRVLGLRGPSLGSIITACAA